jgi:hypothetical protein
MVAPPCAGDRSGANRLASARAGRPIFTGYGAARRAPFGKGHPIWAKFERVAAAFKAAPTVARFSTIRVRWSAGQGAWASVPWFAFLDERETHKTSKGVYVIYLFREDLTGVYLTVNQGVAWTVGSREIGNALLRRHTKQLRERSTALAGLGFELGERIDLRSNKALIRAYEGSTVAHKFYDRGAVPDDTVLLADLGHALGGPAAQS